MFENICMFQCRLVIGLKVEITVLLITDKSSAGMVSVRQLVAVYSALVLKPMEKTDRPIIGILTQETKPWEESSRSYKSYIAASYVKAVEASGGRVVPIFVDRGRRYYEDAARKLNGFLFPGGAADVLASDGYARSGRLIYEVVTEMNRNGDNVPILGVCLGMELLAIIAAGGLDLRTPCSARNQALNLDFLPDFRDSSLYRDASENDLKTLADRKSTSNHHRYCVTQETMRRNDQLEWKILSTSTSVQGETFISSMELDGKPVAAVIFHPEKNAYEWKENQANPHDVESVASARIFYDWLLRQARLNDHRYLDKIEERNQLIYNYNPTYTGKLGLYDTQDYYFS